jgi:hypothetical protein
MDRPAFLSAGQKEPLLLDGDGVALIAQIVLWQFGVGKSFGLTDADFGRNRSGRVGHDRERRPGHFMQPLRKILRRFLVLGRRVCRNHDHIAGLAVRRQGQACRCFALRLERVGPLARHRQRGHDDCQERRTTDAEPLASSAHCCESSKKAKTTKAAPS